MSQTSNECCCDEPVVKIPVRGLELSFAANYFPSSPATDAMPNLQIGVETKRNMLYQGKQVYSQMINFGALPNNTTKAVPHNIPNIDWIQVDQTYSTAHTSAAGEAHPLCHPSSWSSASRTAVGMGTTQNFSARTATICVVYTKLTDPVIA